METKRISEISGSPEQYLRKLKRARNIPALNNDHRLLHIWFKTPPGLGVVGWTKEKIAEVHDAVVARLAGLMAAKGKTYRHKTPMKEQGSRLVARLDLTDEYNRLLQWVSEKLSPVARQEDEGYYAFDDDGFSFSCFPHQISLAKGTFIILKGRLLSSVSSVELSETQALTAANKVLDILGVGYFKDEDAGGLKHFLIPSGDSYVFYFSPDFPEGYWENHTLAEQAGGVTGDWSLVTGKTSNQFTKFAARQRRKSNQSLLMPIRPSGEVAGREVEYEEILKYVKPFKIRSDIIQLTGGVVNNLKTQGDIEIYTEELTNADLQRILAFRIHRGLPPELAERLHFLDDHTGGPFTSRVPLGDLFFIPKNAGVKQRNVLYPYTRIEMQMRSAPEEIKKQAEESKEKDSISISRMFYLMKPLRGAYEDKHQTVENFMELFVAKKFPRLVSKKFDGNTFVAFKSGDKVRIFSDDGLENTEALPVVVDAIRALKQESLIFPFELELWVDGVHYPREAVRSALSTRPEWQPYLTANIFDLLYINGRDIHKLDAPRRNSILQATFEGFQSTDSVPDARLLNIVPQHVAKNQMELEELTTELSAKPASEGVVVKLGRYRLTGTADFDGGVKYHEAAWVNARILGRKETKVEGVFNYEYGLMLDQGVELKPSDLAQEAPPVVRVGKTFSTTLEGKPGDIIQIEFETLNYVIDLSEGSFKVSLWVPKVLSIEERGKFHTVGDAIDRAEAAGILQEKWELEGEIYYDKDKIPQSLVPEKYLEFLSETTPKQVAEAAKFWVASFPEEKEQLWDLQEKLGLPKNAEAGEKGLHLTLAVYSAIEDLSPVENLQIDLQEIAHFTFTGRLLGYYGDSIVLSGSLDPKLSPAIEEIISKYGGRTDYRFEPHITLGTFVDDNIDFNDAFRLLPLSVNMGPPMFIAHVVRAQATTRKKLDGIYLVHPHGELIWQGKKTAIVKSKDFSSMCERDLYLCSGSNCYGIIRLHKPKKITLEEFSELREKHLIDESERIEWWPEKDILFYYEFEFERFELPIPFQRERGIQTFIKDVKLLTEQFQETDPYLEYPEHGKKTGLMRHAHFRGKSVHFDVRRDVGREIAPGKRLVGWTENVQVADKIKEDIDTMAEAKEICKGYSVKQGNNYLKPMFKDEHIVVEEKAPEPLSWLRYKGVVPPGEVGATVEHEGVLYIIDKGTTEWGAQKPYYHEYFDSEGKIFNGRYIVRQLENVWDELTGIYHTVWMAWYADDPTPYVLSKRAVEKEWMPPDGQSALPESIRKLVPSKSQYWDKKGEDAQRIRDELVESKLLVATFNKKGEVNGFMSMDSLLGEDTKRVRFNLAYRSWKGPEVIRKGKSGEDWIIMLTDAQLICYHCSRNPLLEKKVSATLEIGCSDELFDFEGSIPAEHPANPLKRIPIEQTLLDAGKATFLVNEDDFKKVRFEGDVLEGVLTFTKEDGGIWTVTPQRR